MSGGNVGRGGKSMWSHVKIDKIAERVRRNGEGKENTTGCGDGRWEESLPAGLICSGPS